MSIESRSNQYGTVFEHWQIQAVIGQGSGGKTAVFRLVRNDSVRMQSALKVVNLIEERGDYSKISDWQRQEYEAALQDCKNTATQEVLLMNDFQGNTNIVDYLDHKFVSWTDSLGFGCDMLVRMELLADLRGKIKSGATFTESEIVKIGCDICRALILCHGNDILHRDIKPENIFVNRNGDYKLGDFGISRIVGSSPMSVASTGVGTPEYAAPEQSSGSYDRRVDIYSLGLVLYELANRLRLPFASSSYVRPADVTKRIIGTPLPSPSLASAPLATVILKACAFKPEDRYQSAREFMDALNALEIVNSPHTISSQQSSSAKPGSQKNKGSSYETVPAIATNIGNSSSSYATEPALASPVQKPIATKTPSNVSYSTVPAKPSMHVGKSTIDPAKKWKMILDYMAERLSGTVVSHYFNDAVAESFTNDKLIIRMGSDFHQEIVQKRCKDILQDALKELFASSATVVILGPNQTDEKKDGHQATPSLVKPPKSMSKDSWAVSAYHQSNLRSPVNLLTALSNILDVKKGPKDADATSTSTPVAVGAEGETAYDNGLSFYSAHKYEEAVPLFIAATELKYGPAYGMLGDCYHHGHGVKQNDVTAYELYKEGHSHGDVYSTFLLGWAFEYGRGVKQDLKAAARFYSEAAENGSAEAKRNLAKCYELGRGVQYDIGKAFRLYKESAEQGDTKAMLAIARFHKLGKYGKADSSEYLKWITKAADAGNPEGQVALADNKYDEGRSAIYKLNDRCKGEQSVEHFIGIIQPEISEAIHLCKLALDQGYDPAKALLGSIQETLTYYNKYTNVELLRSVSNYLLSLI